ncbi:acyl-ACP desaturase [Rhodococcus sp. NPDC059968]|uniref:acyl-ACP desaturase n=1 Tax=Rhodococcus sp. NPDC059968 TaxID=3347017 RepID=UPI00366E72D1
MSRVLTDRELLHYLVLTRGVDPVALEHARMDRRRMHNFGRNAVLIAKGGIYDLRQHLDDVVLPVLRKWNMFEGNDFGPDGERCREELAVFLQSLEVKAVRFEESRDRALAREARRGETVAAR